MASSSVAISPTGQPDWRKMNKQALRDALASRGLDTNGLRPSLIQRLESSAKAAAEALASSVAGEPSKPSTEASQKESLTKSESQKEGATQPPADADSKALALEETPASTSHEKKETPSTTKVSSIKRDAGRDKATAANVKSEHILSSSAHLSDLEKKRLRAERFGVGLQVSEQEKLALRAERFAGAGLKKSLTAREPESEKRKQRAARFGIVDEESRKKARQERFASTLKQDKSTESDKIKARAARFGAATEQTGTKEKT